MNTTRKLSPSGTMLLFSAVIVAIVAYSVYYAFMAGNALITAVVLIAALSIVLPVLKMPTSIHEDDDSIRVKLVAGEKVFLK